MFIQTFGDTFKFLQFFVFELQQLYKNDFVENQFCVKITVFTIIFRWGGGGVLGAFENNWEILSFDSLKHQIY